jgi:hypothetical protein
MYRVSDCAELLPVSHSDWQHVAFRIFRLRRHSEVVMYFAAPYLTCSFLYQRFVWAIAAPRA